jgi:hypothetical protein
MTGKEDYMRVSIRPSQKEIWPTQMLEISCKSMNISPIVATFSSTLVILYLVFVRIKQAGTHPLRYYSNMWHTNKSYRMHMKEIS